MFATLDFYRASSSRGIWFTKLIVQAFYGFYSAVFVANNFNWIFEETEFYSFFFGVYNFFRTSWHFVACSSVDYANCLSTKSKPHSGCVHCYVSATNNANVFGFV